MLLAYDASGAIVATLDYLVARDDSGNPVGLVDFAAHERAGGAATDIWIVSTAVGSKLWPEWLGGRAHEFSVELAGPPGAKWINALVHNASGFRRERATLEAAIAATPVINGARDIRALVGGPQRPLVLDASGRTAVQAPAGTPANLPLVGS